MGDRLWAGKSSRYVTGHQVNSALPKAKLSTGLWLGLRQGVFTCVGWQVTNTVLHHVTSRSSEMECP